jgi:hypothetical protein
LPAGQSSSARQRRKRTLTPWQNERGRRRANRYRERSSNTPGRGVREPRSPDQGRTSTRQERMPRPVGSFRPKIPKNEPQGASRGSVNQTYRFDDDKAGNGNRPEPQEKTDARHRLPTGATGSCPKSSGHGSTRPAAWGQRSRNMVLRGSGEHATFLSKRQRKTARTATRRSRP